MRAAIYTRISRDAEGEGLGVDRQREDCRALVERRGWQVVAEYCDNDVSASTASTKARPQYDALLSLVEAGEVDVIVGYSNSRLTRRPSEWVVLIALANSGRVQIATVASGQHDLTTADGRAVALTVAAWDSAEAERTSERLRRKWEADATSGKPRPGRWRSYGYTRKYEVDAAEAEVVREIFTRRARGESQTSIARDLTSRGLTTVSGRPWTQSSLAKLVTRPGYCGKREHLGEIVGATNYPSLVDEALWLAANSEGAKASTGTNARRWLLSNIAVCGRCGSGLVGNAAVGGYRCHQANGGCGRIRVRTDWLDGPVVSLVFAREDSSNAASGSTKPAADLAPALAEIDAEIAEVRALRVSRDLSVGDYTWALKDLRARRRLIEEAARSRGGRQAAQTGLLVTRSRWLALDLSQRRTLIGRHLEAVAVAPRATTGPGRFEPERYAIEWVGGGVQQVSRADLAAVPSYNAARGAWTFPAGSVLIDGDGPRGLVTTPPEKTTGVVGAPRLLIAL